MLITSIIRKSARAKKHRAIIYSVIPLFVVVFLLAGSLTSCKRYPTEPPHCDTCGVDTTHHPCDTCGTDTTHHVNPNDTTSHNFIWTEYNIPTESNLTGVWVFDDTTIYAIGSYLYKYNGVEWKRMFVNQTGTGRELSFADFSMFGLSPRDMWIVDGGILDHYIGSEKADEYRPSANDFGGANACWGTSSTDMFFVNVKGNISHFDGSTFTKMASPTTKRLSSMWGTSHNDVWATGYNSSTDESVLLHYDGNEWREDEFSTSGQVRQFGIGSVWAFDSLGHKVSVIAGTRVFRKTDNGIWRKDSSEIGNSLGGGEYIGIGITGNTPSDILAVGGWGFVSHWNGNTWHKYNELYNYSLPIYGAIAVSMKGNTACVVGRKSGKSWIAIGRRK